MWEQGIRRRALSDDLELPNVHGAQCFVPFVHRAESELSNAKCTSLLSDACLKKLLAGLLHELASCGQDVIGREISKRLEKHSFLYAFDIRLAPKALVDEAEAQVVALTEQSNWHAIDHDAPLLHDVLARRASRFVNTTEELCERVMRDRASLEAAFLGARALEAITDIDYGEADTHDGGRRACIVTCDAGSFVYKPHDCRIDTWFYQFVEKHLPGSLRVPHAVVREDALGAYGFCEFIGRVDASDESGIARYWHRMGAACALFYLLGSQDLHGHNFVACGEFPALVDIETALSPKPVALGDERSCPNIQHALGGFTADVAQTLATSGIHAKYDSDQGNLSPFFARNAPCLPVWNEREYDVAGFEDDLSAGFVEGCTALLANGSALMRDVESARECTVRWIVRPTDIYGKLLARLCKADAYDACKRAEILSVLNRPFEPAQPDGEHPLVAFEIASLLDGDVPAFRVPAGSTNIPIGDGKALEGLLATSAVDRALERIAQTGLPEQGFALAVLDANLRFAEVEEESAFVPACELADDLLEKVGAIVPWSGSQSAPKSKQVTKLPR